jgi:uncharacterized protein (TIGR03435 family)
MGANHCQYIESYGGDSALKRLATSRKQADARELHAAAPGVVRVGMMRFWLAAILLPSMAMAQVRFEVASVKPDLNWPPAGDGSGQRGTGGGCPTSMKVDPQRVDFRCASLSMLIGYAYRISPDRVTGPAWMLGPGSPRFDIQAVIPAGAKMTQVPEMFQTLMAERFHLVLHRAAGQAPVYALVVAKGGLKLKAARPASGEAEGAEGVEGYYGETQSRTIAGPDGPAALIANPRMGTVLETGDPVRVQRWEAPSISMAGLSDLLDQVTPLPAPVVDMTGASGRYQLILEVSMAELRAPRPPGFDPQVDIEQAVLRCFNDGLQKLGLRLERRKGRVESLVVDRVAKDPN